MREMKLKAWLIKEKRMVFVDGLSRNKGYGGAQQIFIDNPNFDPCKSPWTGNNEPHKSYINHSMEIHKERAGGDDFILLPYTGLMDVNGKEIYAGYICSWKELLNPRKGPETEQVYGYVTYQPQAAQWWLKFGKYYRELADFPQHGDKDGIRLQGIEAIGNIHDNPELLNQ